MDKRKKYDFDKLTDRHGTNCLKYDFAVERGKPENILPLWVADMDFQVADEITERLAGAVKHGIYGYSESKDSYFLTIAEWMKKYHHWEVERDWLVKTPGVVYAIAMAVRAFTNPGDGVMIQNPVYYPFSEVIRDNDREIVDNTLVLDNGKYYMDFVRFEQQVKEKKVKLFLLCNPHNPVGRVWTKEELETVGRICLENGVIVLSDEIHHDFVYPGHKQTVFATLSSAIQNITISCTAPSKTFNLAGLQVSNIWISNADMRRRFQKEIARTGYSQLNTMGLVACESAYAYGRDWLEQLSEYLKGNLDFVRNYLQKEIPQIQLIEPEGTYLIWLDCRTLGLTDQELNRQIVEKAGLWLDGGSMFGPCGEGFQRMNIACPRSTLKQAMEGLKRMVFS